MEEQFEFETQNDSQNEKFNFTPARSVEGYIIIATNIHEEASEEDVMDFFADFGIVKNIHLNLDRRTGYVKGYVLIEYDELSEAQRAVNEANGKLLLEQTLTVDFAFKESSMKGISNGHYSSRQRQRSRSRSPGT